MRIYIKGGPWTNLEDEVLKAAVMKYGKNQWDRIASLLSRKSAKQCKARWYEWLDPSIKKTPWTREEEEKLLHLVKIMPTQWRTIAPIVGRTAYQCIEHFEFLLDKYQERDEDYDPNDDPRRLRPGEVDYNAEHKPALPDSIDMDEDEKEMLSEAKARMANTMGKKAKRRARERQLEEQRRLSHLKKRRELKAAGIYVIEDKMRKRKKQKNKFKKVNLLKEIPFRKQVPMGYFDTSMENVKSQPLPPERSLERVEGRIKEMEELKSRQMDEEKLKEKKNLSLPEVIKQLDRIHDTKGMSSRGKINLPQPQISDNDIQKLSKVGFVPEVSGGSKVTNNLLSSYSNTPGYMTFQSNTPFPSYMRTPQVSDNLKEQTRQIQTLQKLQTPLMRNPNSDPTINLDFLKGGSESQGMDNRKVTETPNPFKQQMSQKTNPFSVRGTPLRDELRINNPNFEDIGSSEESKKAKKLRMRKKREQLRLKFQKFLPAPKKDEYRFRSIFPIVGKKESFVDEDERVMDDYSRIEKESERIKRLQSISMKKKYPIPINFTPNSSKNEENDDVEVEKDLEERIRRLVNTEISNIVQHDVKSVGVKKRRKKKKTKKYVLGFGERELQLAKELVNDEMNSIVSKIPSQEVFNKVWNESVRRLMENSELLRTEDPRNGMNALKNTYNLYRNLFLKKEANLVKLKGKVNVLTKGYLKVENDLCEGISAMSKIIDEDSYNLESFETLSKMEEISIPKRMQSLKEEIESRKEVESNLQERFKELDQELRMV